MVYANVFLISGAVFVHHLFNCDGSSNVLVLYTRDLHDKHIYHLLVSLGQIPDHTVCCMDVLPRYLKHKLRAAYVLCAPFLYLSVQPPTS